MRPLILTFFALVVLTRLGWWRGKANDSLQACRFLEKAAFSEVSGVYVSHRMGVAQLREVEVLVAGHRFQYAGEAYADPRWLESLSGHRVLFSGRFRCRVPFRNPGSQQDGLWRWQVPPLQVSGKARVVSLRSPTFIQRQFLSFREHLLKAFESAPGFRGLVFAVWTGDASLLPVFLKDFFLEGGLLQIIALSGQHVASLLLVICFLSRLFQWACLWLRVPGWVHVGFRYFNLLLPLSCCGVLWVTSQGMPPLLRAFAMILFSLILRWRRLHCSPFQLVFSSLAILILWDPGLLTSISFLLSAVATAVSVQVIIQAPRGKQVLEYLFVCSVTPFLMMPLTAFLFGKVPWLAPWHTLMLTWLWDLVLIPVAFSVGLLSFFLPMFLWLPLCQALEWAWIRVEIFHLWMWQGGGTLYTSAVRLTWQEFLLVEACLLLALSGVRAKLLSRD